MADAKFRGWFSDVGFDCRVLIICDMLSEFAEAWGASSKSTFVEAIEETRATALLQMDRWQQIGDLSGFFDGARTIPRGAALSGKEKTPDE